MSVLNSDPFMFSAHRGEKLAEYFALVFQIQSQDAKY